VPKQTNSKRYLFQADATGVAVQFPYPFNDVLPIQAASTLPSIGGRGSSRVDEFRLGHILSFGSAYTEVRGAVTEDGVFETVALSVVEDFKLRDAVTCKRIMGSLTGTHPLGRENSIVSRGSVFEGLRIGDNFFERLEVAPAFFYEHATWTDLQSALKDERDRKILATITLPDENGDPVPLPPVGQRTDLLGFSIALGEPTAESPLGRPLRFPVPDFGTVHLGELFCEPSSRRLIMLRVALDGDVQGQVVVGDPIVDGQPYPR
jgi:hypothetical protein